MGPIKPGDVISAKAKQIPDQVFEVFNELITEKWDGRCALVKQTDVVERIVEKYGATREEIFAKGWIDVEDAYRSVGWSVEYDKPGYNENYAAFFVFKRK